MSAIPSVPPDLRGLLRQVGVENFFAHYWQKKFLALQLDAADFARITEAVGPLDIARLAASSAGGAQAWIANDYVAHSVVPVDPSNAADYAAMGATLYFINVPLQALTYGLADFLGAPRQKIIASLFLTPPSNGASNHFDANENFTIQLTGAKRWIVGASPMAEAPPEGHVVGQAAAASVAGLLHPGKVVQEHIVDMRPGSLLYVPRGVLHRTQAGEESWSLNLSYNRTAWIDLVRGGLRHRLGQSARWRGTVTGASPACDATARQAYILPELAAELREMLGDPEFLEALCRDFLDQPDT